MTPASNSAKHAIAVLAIVVVALYATSSWWWPAARQAAAVSLQKGLNKAFKPAQTPAVLSGAGGEWEKSWDDYYAARKGAKASTPAPRSADTPNQPTEQTDLFVCAGTELYSNRTGTFVLSESTRISADSIFRAPDGRIRDVRLIRDGKSFIYILIRTDQQPRETCPEPGFSSAPQF